MDPDQTAPIGLGRHCLLENQASKTFQQMTKLDDFYCDWRFKG